MPGYLLDTNIVSALMHAPVGRLAQPSDRLTGALATVFSELDRGPLDAEAVGHCARLRNQLERARTQISASDMLIAAHALALDATLVTDNEREFALVEGLRVENWLG